MSWENKSFKVKLATENTKSLHFEKYRRKIMTFLNIEAWRQVTLETQKAWQLHFLFKFSPASVGAPRAKNRRKPTERRAVVRSAILYNVLPSDVYQHSHSVLIDGQTLIYEHIPAVCLSLCKDLFVKLFTFTYTETMFALTSHMLTHSHY